MSYILDALRKADAQRERDPARGIHAQPVRLAIGERRLRDGNRIGLWAAAAGGVASLAVVGWYLYRDSAAEPVAHPQVAMAAPAPGGGNIAPSAMSPPPPPPAAAVMPPPVVTAPAIAVAPPVVRAPVAAPQVEASPVSAPPVTAAPPAAAPAAAAGPAVAARSAATAQVQPVPGDPDAEESPRSSRRSRRAALATTVPAAAPPTTPAAQPPVAEPVAGLPADAPKLVISGGVYSGNVAQRMLIVNGQVFNEGSEVGAGVVLEQIRPKAAVLKFRGSRYTVTY